MSPPRHDDCSSDYSTENLLEGEIFSAQSPKNFNIFQEKNSELILNILIL